MDTPASKLVSIAEKDVTMSEVVVVPGVLAVRWNGPVLEQLVAVRRTRWAGKLALSEEAQEWQPVQTVSVKPAS